MEVVCDHFQLQISPQTSSEILVLISTVQDSVELRLWADVSSH